MAAIAVVSVTAVVAWARLAQGGDPPEDAVVVEEMPSVLAGGKQPAPVPAAVTAAVELPVIGAEKLEQLTDEMLTTCLQDTPIAWDQDGPEIEYAFLTTDGIVAALSGSGEMPGGFGMGPGGEQPSGVRVRCNLQLEGDSVVNRGGGGFEEVFDDAPFAGGGFMSSGCCDNQGLATASASVAVPDDTDWLLQDRGSWFLAYEIAGLNEVAVSWKYREQRFGPGGPPMSSLLFLADDGSVVGEAFAGGHF